MRRFTTSSSGARFAAAAAVVALTSVVVGRSMPAGAPAAAGGDVAVLTVSPPAPNQVWPDCVDAEPYCVEEFSVDGAPGADFGDGHLVAQVSIPTDGIVDFEVHDTTAPASLPSAVLGHRIHLVLRFGQIAPRFTGAVADAYVQQTYEDADGNWFLDLAGQPTRTDWLADIGTFDCTAGACGGPTTRADTTADVFSGRTDDLRSWSAGDRTAFAGAYVATDAQYRPTAIVATVSPHPSWAMAVGNTHLTPDGLATTGSFTMWLPPAALAAAGTTPADAVASGLDLFRTDGGTDSPLAGATAVMDDGVYVRVPSLSYSTPTITVALDGAPNTGGVVPDPPTILEQIGGKGTAALSFERPAFDGGTPLTGFRATCSVGAASAGADAGPSDGSVTVPGLPPGVATCTLAATNAVGPSPTSPPATSTVVATTVPDPPTAVVATAGDRQVSVAFDAPLDNGGAALTSFTATVSPGGAHSTGTGSPIVVAGLTNGTDYTVTVTATNAHGASVASAPSGSVRPTAPPTTTVPPTTTAPSTTTPPASPPAFSPVAPVRAVDTRRTSRLRAGGFIEVPVIGEPGIPSDTYAVAANVTAVSPAADGYLTVWPCGTAMPGTSNVNFAAGDVAPNAVLSAIGDGALCVFSSADTNVLVDLTGVFNGSAPDYTPQSPARILDTRRTRAITAGTSIAVPVGALARFADTARAVTFNLTGLSRGDSGYVTAWPCGSAQPGTSNLNLGAGQIRANVVTVGLGTDASVCIYASATTDVLLDVAGAWGPGGSTTYRSIAPTRLVDTRVGTGGHRRLTAGRTATFTVTGDAVPAGTRAIAANLTVVAPDETGYLTAWPCTGSPDVSNVNFRPGQTIANAAAIQLSAGGQLCVMASVDTDVLVDVTGLWR